MAKILTTAIVADIRNKLNGSVFSKNRYGSYVRTKVTPVNPQTTSQQNVRSILSTLAQQWRTLTQAQRQSWIDAAPNFPFRDIYGNSKILSGSTLFQKLNNNLLQAGADIITGAPTPAEIPAIALTALTAAAGTPAMSLTFTPTPVPADNMIVLEATGNVPPGINFVKNKFRRIGIIDAAGTSPDNILAIWQAVHGDLVAGQKVFVRAKMLNTTTGQTGVPAQIMAIVAA
jgi:hypothetical protein